MLQTYVATVSPYVVARCIVSRLYLSRPGRSLSLKELETENARLRRAVSDLTLEKLIPARGCLGAGKPRPSPASKAVNGKI